MAGKVNAAAAPFSASNPGEHPQVGVAGDDEGRGDALSDGGQGVSQLQHGGP
jgi:hypothetical protein